MFSLLADAMFTATLAKRGSEIPERLKTHADRHIPNHERKHVNTGKTFEPFRKFLVDRVGGISLKVPPASR